MTPLLYLLTIFFAITLILAKTAFDKLIKVLKEKKLENHIDITPKEPKVMVHPINHIHPIIKIPEVEHILCEIKDIRNDVKAIRGRQHKRR